MGSRRRGHDDDMATAARVRQPSDLLVLFDSCFDLRSVAGRATGMKLLLGGRLVLVVASADRDRGFLEQM